MIHSSYCQDDNFSVMFLWICATSKFRKKACVLLVINKLKVFSFTTVYHADFDVMHFIQLVGSFKLWLTNDQKVLLPNPPSSETSYNYTNDGLVGEKETLLKMNDGSSSMNGPTWMNEWTNEWSRQIVCVYWLLDSRGAYWRKRGEEEGDPPPFANTSM